MESLPEDVMGLIFSWLPPREVLGPVRAVCHAWRTLSLQRDAWKHASLSSLRDDQKLLARALRLAPCLRSLEVVSDISPEVEVALLTTSCQVERLSISTRFVRCAVNFLRRQGPHTRRLKLAFHEKDNPAEILPLIQDMALEELHIQFPIEMSPVWGVLISDRPFRNNRLKGLSVECCSSAVDLLIESIITENTANLQEFALLDKSSTIPKTMKRLLSNSNLKLVIPVSSLADIIGIKASHVTVRMGGWIHRHEINRGVNVLCKGFINPSSIAFEVLRDLSTELAMQMLMFCLLKMGMNGRCGHVESLAIQVPISKCRIMFRLPTILSKFPNLRELRLTFMPLTRANINGFDVLKSLKLLDVMGSTCLDEDEGCCVPAMWRLIEKLPGLHVIGLRLQDCYLKGAQDRGIRCRMPDEITYGLRGHCKPQCAACARHWHAIGGRWKTKQDLESSLYKREQLEWEAKRLKSF